MKTLLIILSAITLLSCTKNKNNYVYSFQYQSPQISKDTNVYGGSNCLYTHQLNTSELEAEKSKLITDTENNLKITIIKAKFTFEYIDTNGKWD